MNRKMLITIMSLIVLMGTYVATCVILPASKDRNVGTHDEMQEMQGETDTADTQDTQQKYTIVIDPGHGGADPGAEGISGLKEKDINLDISLKLEKLLSDKGYNVIMTRKQDIGLYSENDANKKSADMKSRVDIINNSDALLAVSIHQNSFASDTSVFGFQAMYNSNSEESRHFAELIYQNFKEKSGDSRLRNVQKDNTLYILKNSKVPISLVECGFLTNGQEAELLQTQEYQEKLADILYCAISQYCLAAED